MKKSIICLLFSLSLLYMQQSAALVFPYYKNSDLVGAYQTHQVQLGDDLYAIAKKYDVGYDELMMANDGIDPIYLVPGTLLVIPSLFILPAVKRRGIVISISMMRLFYFPKKGYHVYTYPVGIGQPGWNTPLGKMTIIQKRVRPTWFIPQSVKKDHFEQGRELPRYIRAGKNNPLGKYAMRLSKASYLIHGTNSESGIGRRTTAGCVSLYSKDIKELYRLTPLNTSVRIVRDWFTIGFDDKENLWLEYQDFAKDPEEFIQLQKKKIKEERAARIEQTHLNKKVQHVLDQVLARLHRMHVTINNWSLLSEILAQDYSLPFIIDKP